MNIYRALPLLLCRSVCVTSHGAGRASLNACGSVAPTWRCGGRSGGAASAGWARRRPVRFIALEGLCMHVCTDSAAPAHARTRAHRPAAPRQSSGVSSQTPCCPRVKLPG